jgi:hypothetical protein
MLLVADFLSEKILNKMQLKVLMAIETKFITLKTVVVLASTLYRMEA